MAFLKQRVTLRSLFAAAALFAMTAVHAQNANVVSANSSNDFLFSLNFFGAGGPTATPLNQDHLSYASIQSLTFMVNQKSFTLDLVVADNISGNIAVYPGDFTLGPPVATVIWGPSQGPSAASPNGLTVDAAGNLFVVNSGKSPQLWVFPAAGTPGCTTSPLPLYPALCEPVQIHDTYANGQQLVETVVAPAGAGDTGHLLVATNNPATVLDYQFTGSPNPFSHFTRTPLITTAMFPAHTTIGGLAFWPVDNSLLITNQAADSILRYSCCTSPVRMNDFAGSLGGNGKLLFKIKTSYQATGMPGHRTVAPYAFVAQSGSVSDVLEFNGPGAPQNIIDIHQGLNHPEGLATTTAGAAAADTCIGAGCDPTGLLIHSESGHHSPPLVEDVCVVPADTRLSGGSCPGNLYINDVCPNFDTSGNHMYIPGYLCGTPGFTVIKTLTQHTGFDGTLTDNITQLDSGPACFPAHVNFPFVLGNSPLTTATLAWGPGSGEGNFLARGRFDEIGEVTDGCGYVHGGTSDKSVWIEGLNLDLDSTGLVALVDSKYQDLETTVQTLQGGTLNGVNIATSVANQLSDNNPMGCAQLSQTYFDFATQFEAINPGQQQQDLQIAADLLSNADTSGSPTSSITCDSIVTTNLLNTSPCYPTCFTETPSSSPPVFNPSGQVRVRLANLYFNINSRILGNCPNTVNPCPPNLNDTPEPPAWPPMGPEAVSPPPSGFTECTNEPLGLYPPPGGCPTVTFTPNPVVHGNPVTVTWSLFGSTLLASTSCKLDSGGGDSTFTPAVQVFPNVTYNYSPPSNTASQLVTNNSLTAGTVTYTLTCSGGPEPLSVQFVLNVS